MRRDVDIAVLAEWIAGRRLFVLTGAGVSTGSGIPDYRDRDGAWKRRPPVRYGEFVRDEAVRRRYWARSMNGWPAFSDASPGPPHRAIAALERAGRVEHVVTQNVDRLHQRAGSEAVVDLHGRLDTVVCLDCGMKRSRDAMQRDLVQDNPVLAGLDRPARPDGDADLDGIDLSAMRVPPCGRCGGMLKPDVVFFGESVPKPVVEHAFAALEAADAVLVAGSSLAVWSGYRFCREAARVGKPIAVVNLGKTRADDLADLKVDRECGEVLGRLRDRAESEAERRHT